MSNGICANGLLATSLLAEFQERDTLLTHVGVSVCCELMYVGVSVLVRSSYIEGKACARAQLPLVRVSDEEQTEYCTEIQ